MTVAASIEVGTGGHPGTAPAGPMAHMPGRAVVLDQQPAEGATPRAAGAGMPSFRANWQAQLEALGEAAQPLGMEEIGADGAQDSSQLGQAAVQGSPAPGSAPAQVQAQQRPVAAMAAAPAQAGSLAGRAGRAEGPVERLASTPAESRSSRTVEKEGKRKAAGTETAAAAPATAGNAGMVAAVLVTTQAGPVELNPAGSNPPGLRQSGADPSLPARTAPASLEPVAGSVELAAAVGPSRGAAALQGPGPQTSQPGALEGDAQQTRALSPAVKGVAGGLTGRAASGESNSTPDTAGVPFSGAAANPAANPAGDLKGPNSAAQLAHSRMVGAIPLGAEATRTAISQPPSDLEGHRTQVALVPTGALKAAVTLPVGVGGFSQSPAVAVAVNGASPMQARSAPQLTEPASPAGAAKTSPESAVSDGIQVSAQNSTVHLNYAKSAGSSDLSMQNFNLPSNSAAGSQQPQRGARPSGSAEHRTAAVGAPAGLAPGLPTSMDTGGLVRDLSGTRGAANLANGARGELAPAARDAFAELDSAPASGTVTWTHASPRQAEAGFEDPVLGWVGVRAEMSGGAVHAAVVPGSAEAAQELGRQMEGLHSYLAEQRTPVESLSMASAGGRGGDPGSGQPMQQNAQGQGSEQQGSRDSQALPAIRGAVREIPTLTADSGQITTVDRSVSLDFQAGSNISVMA